MNNKQYRYAIFVALISLIIGLLAQYFLGSISKSWFSFPYNIFAGFTFLILATSVFFLFRKKAFIQHHSSAPFAIVTVAVLGFLTIGLGSINFNPAEAPNSFMARFGLDDLTKTWYFALVFFMALTNLWFSVLKRSVVYQRKNIPFLLNHFGLWLVMFAGVLGQGDILRLKMNLHKDKIEWRATDEQGRVVELPIALELKDFSIDIYPNKLFVIDTLGMSLPKSKPIGFMLEKEGESSVLLDWKITLHQYLEKAIPDTDSTYISHTMWGATNAALVTVEHLPSHKKTTEWISAGNFQLPPRAIDLDPEHTLVMAPAEARKFQSEVLVYEREKETIRQEKIEVNHPIEVAGWRIYQVSYDERMGRWSDLSVVELISDPWLPVVYTGIFMLIIGGIAFLFTNRK
ncbi:MAG: cytochrome c biogenesis protein ResB [Capnocytophaga sp.]|nr:cytochrome c biogenesis protein ResB [Capnocytophaga sp.]